MDRFQRAHPATIFFNLGRIFYLIIIPALRGIISALGGGLDRWLAGAWMDISVFTLMLLIAATSWLSVTFRCDSRRIELKSGILSRKRVFIPWERVSTVTLIKSFYLRPIRALRFRADTLGGSFKDADFSILLSNKQADSIIENRGAFTENHSGNIYKPSTMSIVALSLLTSNSFGGILFISAFISQSGKLLGKEFSEMLIGTFEQAARSLAFGLPHAAAAIGYALLAGWFIGFLLTFVRYNNFTITHDDIALNINAGIFTKRKYFIRYSDINFIDIRKSIVTRLLRLSSLYISAVGYGKQKDDISCVIPTESDTFFYKSLAATFPAMRPAPRKYTPELSGFARFIGAPLSCILGISAAISVFADAFPSWGGFIRFVGFMAYVPAIFFMAIRVIDFRTSGIAFDGNYYTICYSSGFYLHKVVIPKDKIVGIELRQGFFQKFGRYCDLIISSRAERRVNHRCRSLIKSDLIRLFELR